MMGKHAEYIPDPVNTSLIELPENLLLQVETIARNVHEEWAKRRLEGGWQHGTYRDDDKKLHPGLIPFDELTEEEKDYDRQTAISTLKMTVLLGFKITGS
jgi:ryanodine receptor 2